MHRFKGKDTHTSIVLARGFTAMFYIQKGVKLLWLRLAATYTGGGTIMGEMVAVILLLLLYNTMIFKLHNINICIVIM